MDAELIGAVIPCYRSKRFVIDVIRNMPELVDKIYVVDDGCPENSGKWVEAHINDKRVKIIYHRENKGVGGAVISGLKQGVADSVDIMVKIDGDGQMDPSLISKFIAPITGGMADYTKGNRFFNLEDSLEMPRARLLGNAGLSFLSKLSSGYWSVMDPTNGYVAIHTKIVKQLPLDKLSNRYYFESDMLFRLNTIRAVVRDIPMKSRYRDEVSNLSVLRSLFDFFFKNINRFGKRIFYNYFLRDFNPASLLFLFGVCLFMFGVVFGGIKWWHSVNFNELASSGTVMLAALPIVVGFQMLLSAFQYDISNEPKTPIHPML